ncbi:phospholipid-translocating P-type ATPase [Colletotrichum lupini]|uniref:Phospholipid-translocating P-type ATPase n=1 Tax=Colletotrichum lupini TaxID=145971 RepID=A0A9Q8SU21_9PEZI|nr:phospholipid-translocating P-type ATPase [Colletotrichum lupini]UQC82562.1 phospholipid-translocating P-type ATPase [Colletotrichum lupini]
MPSPTSYRSADPPGSPGNDSDSDLDLDIQELDPATTTTDRTSGLLRHDRQTTEHRSPRIALRNLRMGGSRRAGQKARGYGQLGQDRDGTSEDAEALLGEPGSSSSRYRDGSAGAGSDDDSPLLPGGSPPRRRSFAGDRFERLTSSIRLPSFMSNSGAQEPDKDDAQDQDEDDPSSARLIAVGSSQATRFPPNLISNAKYTALTFLPVTLYNEFSFFFNMYFLLVALSQAIPQLRIGYLTTYVAPLAFVLFITMGKEAYDDIERRRRDNEANAEAYTVLSFDEPGRGMASAQRTHKRLKSDSMRKKGKNSAGLRDRLSDIQEEEERAEGEGSIAQPSSSVRELSRKSRDLKVGDVLVLGKGQRVPADVVILKCITSETTTEAPVMEVIAEEESLLVDAEEDQSKAPQISDSKGKEPESNDAGGGAAGETFIRTDQLDGETDWKLRLASPLTQNLTTEEFVRLRVTGGKPDRKVNEFIGTVELLPSKRDAQSQQGALNGDEGNSAPLSIDNTAWANTVIASNATTLAVIMYTGPQTRSALSTAPSRSKTGLLEYEINSLTKILCALTLALSIILVALEGFENTKQNVWYIKIMRFLILFSTIVPISLRVNLDMGKSAYSWFIQRDPGIAGAVVRTSTIPEDLGRIEYLLSDKTGTLTQNEMEMKKIHVGTVSYANEAMDEVTSYVKQGFHIQPTTDPSSRTMLITPSSTFANASNVGATRTRREIGTRVRDVVLALALCHNVTPTTEEEDGKTIVSYQASSPDEIAIVRWTESVGLRLAYRDRTSMILESTENGREIVRVRILDVFPFTSEGKRMGIIVQFFDQTQSTVPNLANSEIWFYQKGADTVMSPIVAENDWLDEETSNMAREGLRTLVLKKKDNAQDHLDFLRGKTDSCLLIDGESLALFLTHFRIEFVSVAVQLPTVVACRCSPTQKAEVAKLIREYTKKRVCCIGDGGNDVSMIQAADVGVGIVGKEGRQASLAADFSIEQFYHLTKLLVWHGRNSYKRSAKLAQFVIHRGLIIAVCQTMYSIAIKFEPDGLYKDWLLVGYSTVYTAFPVLSLVLDKDVDENLANLYPELYKELTSGRSLSYRTFFVWVAVSIYQGCTIQGLSQLLTEVDGPKMVAVSYTVLVLNELLMVAIEITTWHPAMIISIVGTFLIYVGSVPFLGGYFDLQFIITLGFIWRVLAIAAISLIPPYAVKLIRRTMKPPSYRKVQST